MIEASSGKVRFGRRAAAAAQAGMPIGEADANIFDCPSCARPLGASTTKCPGCGTRVVARVPLGRAAGFVVVGLMIGLGLGAGGTALAMTLTRPAAPAVVQAPPAAAPSLAASAAPLPSAQPAPPLDPAVPSAAISALRQTTVVNQRILVDAERLGAALAVSRPTAKDLAPILRGLSVTSGYRDRLAPDIARWAAGETVSAGYVAFYGAIGAAAEGALTYSITNDRVYVDAGRRILAVVTGLTDLDAATRALAAQADLELPALVPAGP
jgi:hypothetical protein